jgi:hypothetical protein
MCGMSSIGKTGQPLAADHLDVELVEACSPRSQRGGAACRRWWCTRDGGRLLEDLGAGEATR